MNIQASSRPQRAVRSLLARPKARVPRGFRDRFGAEIVREREMLARISAVYESFGFDPLETPAFEYTDALGKFLPDIDRPNQGVFSLQDDDDQWMSLRYDLTAPLARFVAIAVPERVIAITSSGVAAPACTWRPIAMAISARFCA